TTADLDSVVCPPAPFVVSENLLRFDVPCRTRRAISYFYAAPRSDYGRPGPGGVPSAYPVDRELHLFQLADARPLLVASGRLRVGQTFAAQAHRVVQEHTGAGVIN